MKVVWTEMAKKQLRYIARYIRNEFGISARERFMQEVDHANHLLSGQPNIGSIESQLDDCVKSYRSYVINRYDKIVYNVGEKQIEVVAFWDCRQSPKKLVSILQ